MQVVFFNAQNLQQVLSVLLVKGRIASRMSLNVQDIMVQVLLHIHSISFYASCYYTNTPAVFGVHCHFLVVS